MSHRPDRNNATWFIDQLALYQNANSSAEAVKRNFKVRIAQFELIIGSLRQKQPGDSLQHELILGWRGSGKSTLLKRIQIEIDEAEDLRKKYIAINLAEEQNAVYRLSDLWYEVYQELEKKSVIQYPRMAFDAFDSDQEYARYLYRQIQNVLADEQKRIVLLLDNIDRIFENIGDQGNLLREQLINGNNIQLIGASTRISEHFWRYDLPFYDFFRVQHLEGLNFEEIHTLLNHWSQEMYLPELWDYAIKNKGRVEAMRILTNGVPRALQIFIQLLLHDSSLYGFDYLRKIMDQATPLYQERLNYLTPAERKVVQELAFFWKAVSTKTLVQACRMESKTVSMHLVRLTESGIVEKISTGKKNHLYRLNERFFNMWLIVTQGNPSQKRKAKYLTYYLETWYDGHEIRKLLERHLLALKESRVPYDKAVVLSKALAQSKYLGIEDREILINSTLAILPDYLNDKELPESIITIFNQIHDLLKNRNFDSAMSLAKSIDNEADGIKDNLIGIIHLFNGNYSQSEMHFLKSIQYGDTDSIIKLAELYQIQNKPELAEKYYLKAIAKGRGIVTVHLAQFYEFQNKIVLAEKYFKLAVKIKHTIANLFLASLYYKWNVLSSVALGYFGEYEKYSTLSKEQNWHQFEIIIELWNQQVDQLETRVLALVEENTEHLEFLLTHLLYHQQVFLVLSLFESEAHGAQLQERYMVLYYVALILAGKTEDNLLLRIPPELASTIEQVIQEVKAKQAFYARPPASSLEEALQSMNQSPEA